MARKVFLSYAAAMSQTPSSPLGSVLSDQQMRLWRERVLSFIARYRRSLVLVVIVLAALLLAQELRPRPPMHPVVIAAADLPAGMVLQDRDVRVEQVIGNGQPPGIAEDIEMVLGQRLIADIPEGQAIAQQLLLAPLLNDNDAPNTARQGGSSTELVVTPLSLAAFSSTEHILPGDVVDVLATAPSAFSQPAEAEPSGNTAAPPATKSARVIVRGAQVVSPRGNIQARDTGFFSGSEAGTHGSMLLLTDLAAAQEIAAAAVHSQLSFVVRANTLN